MPIFLNEDDEKIGWNRAHEAVLKNDIRQFRQYLLIGDDSVWTPDSYGNTPAHIAARLDLPVFID